MSRKCVRLFSIILIGINITFLFTSEKASLYAITDTDIDAAREEEDRTVSGQETTEPEDTDTIFDVERIELESLSRRPEFHGFLKLGLPINGHKGDTANVFDQTELTLWFGMDIFRNFSFVSEAEFDEGFEEFTFERFEFNWNIYRNLAIFKFGKFIYPFGIERLVEDAPLNKFINRPSPFKQIIPGTYSDNGIELYGIVPLISTIKFKYELALTAGLSWPSRKGEQNFAENNDSRTIGGRLGFVIFPGLEIGSSYSTGKYDDNERSRLDFLGFDLVFQKGGFELRGEYIRGNVESSKKITESFDRDGYYVQASYKYKPELNHFRFLEGVARFDSVDPNDLVTNKSDTDRVSFGINYSPMEHIELKLEYVLENEATENLEKKLLFQTILRW